MCKTDKARAPPFDRRGRLTANNQSLYGEPKYQCEVNYMQEKIISELLEENPSDGRKPHETLEIKVDNLHFPPGEVSQNGNKPSTSSPTAEEDWDLDLLRLDQNFDTIIGAQQVLTVVRVRKPNNQEWFRIHPSEEWRLQTTVLRLKEDREDYLVHPNVRKAVWDEIQPVMLFSAINRQGEVFIWPVRLPRGDGRTDPFMESDMVVAKEAERKWARRQWLPENKAHKILVAQNLLEEPVWPEITFQELIKKAFKDRYICDPDHPVLKLLRGDG